MSLRVSFEFFAPKTISAAFALSQTAQVLDGFDPAFMSVTCGAGGAGGTSTLETVQALNSQCHAPIYPHMTCAQQSKDEVLTLAKTYQAPGVVALRGDADAHVNGYKNACELTAALHQEGQKNIMVAAYPETHPLAENAQGDLDWLKAKQDAGANGAITQFFFDADIFLRFRDRAQAAGITMELIPGILPVHKWSTAQKMIASCGASVAPDLAEGFARAQREERGEWMALAQAAELCDGLRREGVDHFHIYTLNRSDIARSLCESLGLGRTLEVVKAA